MVPYPWKDVASKGLEALRTSLVVDLAGSLGVAGMPTLVPDPRGSKSAVC